jgi:hypothetical protein
MADPVAPVVDEEEEEAPPPEVDPPPEAPPAPRIVANRELVIADNLPGEEEIEPEDFFRDFREYISKKLDAIETASRESSATLSTDITKEVQTMHADLSNSINHLSAALESNMMDLKFLTQPPDADLVYLANRCNYLPPNREAMRDHKNMMQGQYGFLDGNYMRLNCNAGSIQEEIKNNRARAYFIVVSCAFHHFSVENLAHMSILSRTRLIIEDADGNDVLMFIYLLKRGL